MKMMFFCRYPIWITKLEVKKFVEEHGCASLLWTSKQYCRPRSSSNHLLMYYFPQNDWKLCVCVFFCWFTESCIRWKFSRRRNLVSHQKLRSCFLFGWMSSVGTWARLVHESGCYINGRGIERIEYVLSHSIVIIIVMAVVWRSIRRSLEIA